jgi:glycosyltransferase involved in cell wall biosynthesis
VPHVTAVVPTHNRSRLLARTLRTLLWQRDVDFEVVVVDDGSADDTAEMIAAMDDPRLRVVRHDHPQGVANARNRGVSEARGQWVAFCDDDDLWAPDKLVSQIQVADRSGRGWVYGGAVQIADDLRVLGGRPPPPPQEVRSAVRRFNAVPGGGSGVLVHRDLLRRAGGFDSRLFNTEDWDLWIRLAQLDGPAWVPRPLVAYRVHRGNASLVVREILAGTSLIERKHRLHADRGVIYRAVAESLLRSGQRGDAVRYLALAAAHGNVSGVVDDLRVAVARRLRRHLSRSKRSPEQPRHQRWVDEADAWLAPLRQSLV